MNRISSLAVLHIAMHCQAIILTLRHPSFLQSRKTVVIPPRTGLPETKKSLFRYLVFFFWSKKLQNKPNCNFIQKAQSWGQSYCPGLIKPSLGTNRRMCARIAYPPLFPSIGLLDIHCLPYSGWFSFFYRVFQKETTDVCISAKKDDADTSLKADFLSSQKPLAAS